MVLRLFGMLFEKNGMMMENYEEKDITKMDVIVFGNHGMKMVVCNRNVHIN